MRPWVGPNRKSSANLKVAIKARRLVRLDVAEAGAEVRSAGRVDHPLVRLAALGRQRGEDFVEHAQPAPFEPYQGQVERFLAIKHQLESDFRLASFPWLRRAGLSGGVIPIRTRRARVYCNFAMTFSVLLYRTCIRAT